MRCGVGDLIDTQAFRLSSVDSKRNESWMGFVG